MPKFSHQERPKSWEGVSGRVFQISYFLRISEEHRISNMFYSLCLGKICLLMVWKKVVSLLHCPEEGCIGLYTCTAPKIKRFPEAQEMSRGSSTSQGPREISRTEGMYNLIDTDSRQCTANHSSLIHPLGCIRKYIPIPHPMCQIVLGLLKLILPCIVFSSH